MRRNAIVGFPWRSLLALAAAASAASAADAAVYRGRFTPDYGAPFSNLYWNGSLEVYAPDACVPGSPATISLASCAGIEITAAVVNLYDKADKGTILQTMDFRSAAGSQLNGLNWLLSFGSDEKLLGANSTAFPAIQGAIAQTQYGGNQAWFSLQFLGDYAQLYWFDKEPKEAFFGLVPDEVVLTAGGTFANPLYPLGPRTITVGEVCRRNGVVNVPGALRPFVNPDQCGWSDPDNISKGAFITFERVPEPAGLALVPLALGILGLVGRRSRRRAQP